VSEGSPDRDPDSENHEQGRIQRSSPLLLISQHFDVGRRVAFVDRDVPPFRSRHSGGSLDDGRGDGGGRPLNLQLLMSTWICPRGAPTGSTQPI